MPTLLLLGSGELGKEFVICAKQLGCKGLMTTLSFRARGPSRCGNLGTQCPYNYPSSSALGSTAS
jgi:hypothetical protein